GPVRWHGGEQGIEVGRADDVHAAGEGVGGAGQADERRVAAVAAAHDRDLVGGGDAGVDRPLHRIDQVVVHPAGPLAVAGVGELLAEAGGAAVVHAQHGVAAVGQPLVIAAVAVGVARPGAAVHQQHHRHRPV